MTKTDPSENKAPRRGRLPRTYRSEGVTHEPSTAFIAALDAVARMKKVRNK